MFQIFFFFFLSFRILVDEDADLLAVNNEGEVPLDLAEEDEMDEYISEVMDEKGKTSNNQGSLQDNANIFEVWNRLSIISALLRSSKIKLPHSCD